MKIIIVFLIIAFTPIIANSYHYKIKWQITAYCACKKCCGKNAKGITASGKPVKVGVIACNMLPFGSKVSIDGLGVYTVQDRGCRRLFNGKAHIDIYMASHEQAQAFGVKYLYVNRLDN